LRWSLDSRSHPSSTSCVSSPWRFPLFRDPAVKLIHPSWYCETYYIISCDPAWATGLACSYF